MSTTIDKTIKEVSELLKNSDYKDLKKKAEEAREQEQAKALKLVERLIKEFELPMDKVCKMKKSLRHPKTKFIHKRTKEVWGGLGRKPQDLIDNPNDWESFNVE